MRLLVATRELQGAGDRFDTVDGELVTPVVATCATPGCRCNTSFIGLASSGATSTALVVELPHLGTAELREALEGALERDGWLDLVAPEEIRELVDEHVEAIEAACARFIVGTVVERHGRLVNARSIADAA